jgi:hypothetical protein
MAEGVERSGNRERKGEREKKVKKEDAKDGER